jgi:hypothetical protein
MAYLKAGHHVSIRAHKSAPGKGLSYPNFSGVLAEDCRQGGWDVVDVIDTVHGKEQSVYSFSVESRTAGEWIHKESIYSDPSAAHEKALKLQSSGAASIRITPRSGRYVLRWMERGP